VVSLPTRIVVLCCVTLYATPLLAQTPRTTELKKLSIEQLMAIDVTSVSRAPEPLGTAPAAVAVVTNEDITRMGATSVPEALRLVPGLHVARQTGSSWAISSRGFSSITSEKLLVLSEGRSLYTPLFSGVFWDSQNYLLQDIERIEVIRGPGATLWGANAVNGVINIITKSARNTQGLYVETSAGSEEHASVGARYGGQMSDNGYYRVFGRYFDRDDTFHTNPASPDDWQAGQAGFRTDWEAGRDTLTLQGDVYSNDLGRLAPSVTIIGRPGPTGRLRLRARGGSMLGRWRRNFSPASGFQLRVYYDRTRRNDPSFVDDLDTVDLDFLHRFVPGPQQELTWNLNYRATANGNHGKGIFALEPTTSQDNLVSGFVQDHIRIGDALRVTVGTKIEHNDFSGFEVQPSGRVAWDAKPGHMVWGAISRAVRVPTRLERDIAIDVTDPSSNPFVRLLGNRDFDSERLIAYEGGYRWQTLSSLAVDVATFYNSYDELASLEIGDSFVDQNGRTVIPVVNENLTTGRTHGIEVMAVYSPVPASRLTATYSHVRLKLDPEGQDLNRGAFLDGATPRHQFGLRASFDLPGRVQFDAMFRHLSDIERLPPIVSGDGIDGYAELDLRLAWDAWRQLQFSVVGQNLLRGRHVEFGPPEQRGEMQRGVYGKIAWGF
jgi:iron complex outermembrane recepter protein